MEFQIKGEYIQLDKLLKICDIADSGAQAHMMVDEGTVLLNGFLVTERRKKISSGDIVEIKGKGKKISVI